MNMMIGDGDKRVLVDNCHRFDFYQRPLTKRDFTYSIVYDSALHLKNGAAEGLWSIPTTVVTWDSISII